MSKQTLQLHSTELTIHSLDVNDTIDPALLQQAIFLLLKLLTNYRLFVRVVLNFKALIKRLIG
ncbi:hypothetical protein SAMN04487854_101236 [Pseudoalteromonas lipolytica]|uniref:Uncharacterized protein n=1 Tax=Pseudoalteromonas lipolytica TaxID=570156 RepID=A0ABY1G9U6_9GAMM|nr:hypothetical protein SAMN04487854_101236 [Pseudoalteromonas lipolytica]